MNEKLSIFENRVIIVDMDSENQNHESLRALRLSGALSEAGGKAIGPATGLRQFIELHKIFIDPRTRSRTRRSKLQTKRRVQTKRIRHAPHPRPLNSPACGAIKQGGSDSNPSQAGRAGLYNSGHRGSEAVFARATQDRRSDWKRRNKRSWPMTAEIRSTACCPNSSPSKPSRDCRSL